MAGTPTVELPEHWHGISWIKKTGLKEPGKKLFTGGL